MGLARAARPAGRVGVGVDGASAGRVAGPLRPVARRPVRSRWTSRTWSTGLDRISRGLGGVTAAWRFDRMATVCHPGSGRVTAIVRRRSRSTTACRWRSARRGAGTAKGVVEKANHTAAQRWWRTLADEMTIEQAQARLDRFAHGARRHPAARATAATRKATVATVAAARAAAAGPAGAVPGC